MMIRTYNIQLLMNEETASHWLTLLKRLKAAYNRCVQLISDSKCFLSITPVHNVCYKVIREEFPELPSQMVIRMQKEAMQALKSRKSNRHDGKRPRKKSLSVTLDKRLYSNLSIDGISLASGNKCKRARVPFKLYGKADEMFRNYFPKDPTLFYRNGVFFLSVPFEVPEKPVIGDTSVGVDLGERQLFVTSEGKSFADKKYLAARRRIRYNKRMLQQNGSKSARRKLRRLKRLERNLSKDMCHRAAKALIASTNAQVIVMEKLDDMKKKTSRTKTGLRRTAHNRRLGQVPMAEFQKTVRQKAQLDGKRVETVSPAYTSQTDSRTGKRDGKRIGRRYVCSDGAVLDADWNAAVNIALKSKHPVSSDTVPLEGGLTPLTGRPMSTGRKRCKPC